MNPPLVEMHETNATAMRLYDRVAAKSCFIVYRRELAARAAKETS